MNKRIIAIINPKAGLILALAAACVLVVAPRMKDKAAADVINCQVLTTNPTISQLYPVSTTSPRPECTDRPAVAAFVNGNFYNNVNAQAGDVIEIDAYVHNAATDGSPDANDVNVDVYIDSYGSSHNISMQANSSNAGSVSGSMTIATPNGAALEVVPGSAHIEDFYGSYDGSGSVQEYNDGVSAHFSSLGACFQYSKFIVFQVRVVSQASGNNTITATPGNQIGSQCLRTGTVSWTNASNVQSVEVTVQDLTDNSSVNSITGAYGSPNSTVETPYLTPGNTYRYVMYDTTNGQHNQIAETTENVPALNCGAPVTGNNTITFNPGNQIGSQCLRTGTVSWTNASDVQNVEVTVQDLTTYSNVNSVTGTGGSPNTGTDTPWLTPGDTYKFIMYNTTNGQYTQIAETTGTVPALNCGAPVTGNNTITAVPGGQIGSQCLRTGTVSWTNSSDVQSVNVFVQDVTVYSSSNSITGSAGAPNTNTDTPWLTPGHTYQYIMYDTTNGQFRQIAVTTENVPDLNCDVQPQPQTYSATATATASASATASCGNGTTATASASASATATATSNVSQQDAQNQAQTKADTQAKADAQAKAQAQATVNCPVTQTLTCSANMSQVNINQAVTFTANGGNGTYSWTGGQNPATGNGKNFTTSYSSSGTKTVTVSSSDGQQANCNTTVKAAAIQTLSCNAVTSSVDINQTATFVASGGNGTYSWTGGQNPATGNGTSFSTSYAGSGIKTVTVTSGDGQNAQCSVNVKTPTVQPGSIILSKQVRNVTQGGSSFSDSVSAKNGDTLEYQISVAAGSSVALNNVVITDTLVSGLSYVSGSLTVNGSSHAPGLTSGGLTFNQVTQSPVVIKYQSKVTVNSGTLINTAQASASNAPTVTDQALATVTYVQEGQPALTITKTASTNSAKRGDTVSYQIVVRNVGQAVANNVYISDNIPSAYQPQNVNVSRSTGGTWPAGISVSSLAVNESVTVSYSIVINQDSGTIVNTATASASNAATVNASAVVNISQTNNGSVINNSYNNTCVNNSCNYTNTVYMTTAGNVVPISQVGILSVTKSVRNANSGTFGNSVTANNGETVEFEIIVANTGSQNVNNVRLNDTWNGGLGYVSGSTRIDGANIGDAWSGNTLNLGSLYSGQQKRVTFAVQVNTSGGNSIQNIARVSGDNVSTVQDDAWVFTGAVAGGSVNLTYSKKAYNETKRADAVSIPAAKEDYITYTLSVYNNGNTPANNFVITDDLSAVLPYADIVDNGGGMVSGNIITFPGLTIPAGSSVSKSFRVRVKYFLADNLNYVMSNTYGNTVTININTPQVKGAFVAPKTGANTTAFLFAAFLTSGFALLKKKEYLLKLLAI